jgi:hypothetical protein
MNTLQVDFFIGSFGVETYNNNVRLNHTNERRAVEAAITRACKRMRTSTCCGGWVVNVVQVANARVWRLVVLQHGVLTRCGRWEPCQCHQRGVKV